MPFTRRGAAEPHRSKAAGRRGIVSSLAAGCFLLALACTQGTNQEQRAARPESSEGLAYDPPPAGSYRLPPIQAAADGAVIDADGSRRRLSEYLGDRHVFLSFVYTRCKVAKACPLATATLHGIKRKLEAEPELADQVRFITLSFDPERDTPEVMRRFAPRGYTDTALEARPWVFLTTSSRAELQPILDGYGQYVVPELDPSGEPTGDFLHVLKIFLIDRERQVRNIYSSGFIHPTLAINDLKTLLLEEAGAN